MDFKVDSERWTQFLTRLIKNSVTILVFVTIVDTGQDYDRPRSSASEATRPSPISNDSISTSPESAIPQYRATLVTYQHDSLARNDVSMNARVDERAIVIEKPATRVFQKLNLRSESFGNLTRNHQVSEADPGPRPRRSRNLFKGARCFRRAHQLADVREAKAIDGDLRAPCQPDLHISSDDLDSVQSLSDDRQVFSPQKGWSGIRACVAAQQILSEKIV